MLVNYIEIENSFYENKPYNYKCTKTNDYLNKLLNPNPNTSIFEILYSEYNKFYFDIETPKKYTGTDQLDIYRLIDEIRKTFKMLLCDEYKNIDNITASYVLTMNKNSIRHKGESYHLIFYNMVASKKDMYKFVNYYIDSKRYGNIFIDNCVYSKNRLFRAVNQPGINDGLIKEDKHKIICVDGHKISESETNDKEFIKKSVIQDITEDQELIIFKWDMVELPKHTPTLSEKELYSDKPIVRIKGKSRVVVIPENIHIPDEAIEAFFNNYLKFYERRANEQQTNTRQANTQRTNQQQEGWCRI